jgi:hypothetical protein
MNKETSTNIRYSALRAAMDQDIRLAEQNQTDEVAVEGEKIVSKVVDDEEDEPAVSMGSGLSDVPLPAYMIRGGGITVLRWDILIIFLSIYNSITITLQIAFDPPELRAPWVMVIDSFIDLIFLFDIVVTFRTTQLDAKTGQEITDQHVIAKNYMKGRFLLDLVSSLPFEAIF